MSGFTGPEKTLGSFSRQKAHTNRHRRVARPRAAALPAAADAEMPTTVSSLTSATPLARQVANVLNTEGFPFIVATPGRGLRLALDRGRDDFIELALETTADLPTVVGRIRRTRGSRTIEDERPIKAGAHPIN